jgi:hypothetical protein
LRGSKGGRKEGREEGRRSSVFVHFVLVLGVREGRKEETEGRGGSMGKIS